VPKPEMRVSDDERSLVVERLHQAVGEGRLTLAEFEDRVAGALGARTRGDLELFTADLPETAGPAELVLRSRASSLRRSGRWVVPSRLVVEAQASGMRLDLTQAVVPARAVEVVLDVRSSSLTLVLPPGGSATIDDVEMSSSSARSRVATSGGLHVTVRGHLRASSLRVRYQRRFLHWRW
jgi:DUF1707 SHOCT-like domain